MNKFVRVCGLLHTLIFGAVVKADEASLLVQEIPRVRLVDNTVEEAINQTLILCAAVNPEARDVKGVIVKRAVGDQTRITMDLRNVPLASAFACIALGGLYTWEMHDGTVTFTAISIADNVIATEPLIFNQKIRTAFGLSGMTSAEEVRRVLERLKISESLVEKIAERKDMDLVLLRGTWAALNEIKCVFALINRGISIPAEK